ncbi:MAG: DUF418 domain-containing protein [Chloroflexota bacterium]
MTQTAVSPPNPTTTPMTPVKAGERIQIIDSLRGFALLGILLVNMALFINPIYKVLFPLPPDTPLMDQVVSWLIRLLAEGKFYPLFSLLFGLGFAIQFGRAQERNRRIVPLYMRRMFFLLLIGAAHAFLVWTGDILILYALLGFLLILFHKARPRTLLIWIGLIATGYFLLLTLGVAAIELSRLEPTAAAVIDRNIAEQEAFFREELAQATAVYSQGSYMEVVNQRVREYVTFVSFGAVGLLPSVFVMFLIGLYLGKRRVFFEIEENLSFFRKLTWWGLAIGLPANLIYASLMATSLSQLDFNLPVYVATVGQLFGGPALCLFYVGALTLLSRHQPWTDRLQVLAPVGRMALTNYLMQSIICTFIFYGYGLGLLGQIGAAAGLLLTLLIFGLQIPFSHWWMARFRYGPFEWLWRSLTYMRPQPMARTT